MATSEKPLLILDLDETLLFATEQPLEQKPDFHVGPYWIYLRPFLNQFLKQCQIDFELAVWSSSGEDYLEAALKAMLPKTIHLAFAWSRESCVQRFDPESKERYFVKDLKKVKRRGFNLDQVLIVDDTPKKVERNYGSAVYVTPFYGDPSDDELNRLSRYLKSLRGCPNFRRIEKRRWKGQC